MGLMQKPVYTLEYFNGKGTTGYMYKSWKTPKTAIKHARNIKAYIEQNYGMECTIKCHYIPAEISWNVGPEYKFTISVDECSATPGFQKIESFTRRDGSQHVNFYRNCRHGSDYHGSHVFSREEWERVAPPARD